MENKKVECVHINAACTDVYDTPWGFTFFVRKNEASECMLHTMNVLLNLRFQNVEVKMGEVILHLEEKTTDPVSGSVALAEMGYISSCTLRSLWKPPGSASSQNFH